MEKKDWILLVTSCAEDRGLTPVQLQKSLFLLRQKMPMIFEKKEYYEFIAYDYGPFCIDIYRDAENLASEGLININMFSGKRFEQYSITLKGLKATEKIKKEISGEIYEYIHKVIQWIVHLTFPQLIRSIYKEFPSYSKNSVFKGQL
ncbi:MAG: hypothetical protein P9X22_02310 [Candidatus Zapsychrus exili]|nr:hypothetical protein [Candidatus Zapsychrus exili]